MRFSFWRLMGCSAAALGTVALASAAAQDTPPKPAPNPIWQAGLQQLAGRYIFVQVASPGGLWERFTPKQGLSTSRQVSINELPSALRDRLTKAEIVISDLKLPTQIEADERESPSKRGKLRFYNETGHGRLVMRNLPGIGGNTGDAGEYSGPVTFHIEHRGHSNPSISGILLQRINQEATWGVAAIDFADLTATAPPKKEGEEAEIVIGNARILRSGVEIFAFMEWRTEAADGERTVTGAVRLARRDAQVGPRASLESFLRFRLPWEKRSG